MVLQELLDEVLANERELNEQFAYLEQQQRTIREHMQHVERERIKAQAKRELLEQMMGSAPPSAVQLQD